MKFHGGLLQWNAIFSFFIGSALNSLLIFLCVQDQKNEMRDFRRILLQISNVDLTFLIISVILQPIFVVYRGMNSVCYLNAPWMESIEPFWQSFLVAIWLTLYFFSCYGFSAQALYRYFVVNKSMQIKFCHYLLMLSIPAVICFILGFGVFANSLIAKVTLNSMQREELSQFLIGEIQPNIDFAWIVKLNSNGIGYILFQLTINISAFGLIIFCSYNTLKFIRTHSCSQQEKNRNREITRSLLIMAIFPLLICINNLVGGLINSTLTPSDVFSFNIVGAFLAFWLPVINPLISLLTLRPFRRKIVTALFKKNFSTSIPKVAPPMAISCNEVTMVRAATQINQWKNNGR